MKSPEHNPASAETACLRIGDEDPANLVRLSAEAASALIRGDIDTYLTLIRHTSDYTLMAPFGGAPTRGFDTSPDRLAQLRRYFQGGKAELKLVQSYVTPGMVVIAAIERQHGKIGGLPEQVWSLRVTLVFRHEDSGWRLAHRHADPLVHEIGLEQAAGIARGKQASHTVKEPGGSECKCIQGIPP